MIRKFVPEDREDYIRFSTEFYNSSAVDKPVQESILSRASMK